MMFLADPSLSECRKYASFSASERPGRSCIEMENCSQNVRQLTTLPSNLGVSNLGSLTPVSWTDGEAWLVTVGDSSSLILSKQSNNSLSSRACETYSSSESSTARARMVLQISPSSILRSRSCSSY